MTLENVLIGLAIGMPIMIAAGPISILLLDQGLERGVRRSAPAVLGVASADLTFAILAALGGASVTRLLEPWQGWLAAGAAGVLGWLAVDLGRSAARELRTVPAAGPVRLAMVGPGPGGTGPTATPTHCGEGPAGGPAGGLTAGGEHGPRSDADALSPFARVHGTRLAAAFYGLTMVNPLTIVLFSSVVVAGGAGIGTAGWAAGMALASFVAHGAYAVVGAVLGARLGPRSTALLRGLAAAFMAALALHLLVG
jgi:threonine/homoserine/homoserine lactone efflux protein